MMWPPPGPLFFGGEIYIGGLHASIPSDAASVVGSGCSGDSGSFKFRCAVLPSHHSMFCQTHLNFTHQFLEVEVLGTKNKQGT